MSTSATSERLDISYAEIGVYAPTLLLTLIIIFRLGFHRQLGWIYLSIFCVIRIAGSVFGILAHNNPTDTSDVEWAGILQSVGLSPLILATLGLLKRVIDETSERLPSDPNSAGNLMMSMLSQKSGIFNRVAGKATATSRRSRVIQLLQLPSMIALILCILGGMDEASSDPSDQAKGPGYMKAGICMFIVIYVLLICLTGMSVFELHKTPTEEKRVLFVVVIALPLLGSRLLWSTLSVFTSSDNFNSSGGSVIIQVCMATIEEFLIVIMYVIVGFTVSKYGYNPRTTSNIRYEQPVGYNQYQGYQQPMEVPRHTVQRGPSGRHQTRPSNDYDERTRVGAYYASQQRGGNRV